MSFPRILVVDDDQDHCLLIQRVLVDHGFEVDVVHDALSALRLYGERTHDLVILDYRMPDMDGMELFEMIKLQWFNVPVVFYTGYATIDMINAALTAGAKRVISKHVDNTELIEAVHEILNPEAS